MYPASELCRRLRPASRHLSSGLSASLQFTLSLAKGTLLLPVLYWTIIACSFTGCKSPAHEQKEILHDFDSINRQLQKIESLLNPKDALYDSLLAMAWNKGGQAQQLNYTLVDFHGYMFDLRSNFYRFAGDKTSEQIPPESEDSIELTNVFFNTERFGIKGLSSYMQSVMKDLRPFTRDTAIAALIDKFNQDVSAEKLKSLFRDVPPVAAVTMLRYFEKRVKEIERDVLKDYFQVRTVSPG